MPLDDSSLDIILRLALAIVAGGLIGAEREYMSKSAGLRTLMIICLGSCMFTICSILLGEGLSPDRIASNIVTGIGFLGAGVIFKEENRVKGLTTAAAVWVTAAIGMAIGGGYYWEALGGTVFTFFALNMMRGIEDRIEKMNQLRTYRIMCEYKHETLKQYEVLMTESGLKPKRVNQRLQDNMISGSWIATGSETHHEAFIKKIMEDKDVREFDF